MSGFNNAVVGGSGILKRPAIQSPNFNLPAQTGWAIKEDGSAYFFNVTVVGIITGGTVVVDGPTGGIFVYSGPPVLGNLIGSWTGQSGTDTYGNVYPAGLSVTQGDITGMDIDSTTITNSVLQGGSSVGTAIQTPAITGGTATEVTVVFDTNGGQLLVYTSTLTTVTQNVAGTYSFTCPATVTAAKIETWGGSAGGNGGTISAGGSAGGAGEYAQEPNYTLLPGNVYPYQVGAGGAGNSTGGGNGADGTASFFNGSGVIANPGLGNGTGGTGSTNSVHHNGGNGGAASGNAGGASGGNSGNATAPGNNGSASTGTSGAASPAGQSGSGNGGAGGNSGANGSNGGPPGGGGGGAGKGSTTNTLTKTYTPVWIGSYYGPDSTNGSPNGLRSTSTMFQGGETASGGSANGNQRSVFAINRAQIAADFAGYTVTACYLTMTNQHSWYGSGMTVEIDEYAGLPGTVPSTFPAGNYADTPSAQTVAEGATKNFALAASVGQRFVSGTSNGLGIGYLVPANNPYNLNYYGYFSSTISFTITATISGGGNEQAGNGSDGQVKITYTSGSTLLAGISPVPGTDQFGNAFGPGVTLYKQPSTPAPVANGSLLYANAAGTIAAQTPAGVAGTLDITQADTSVLSVTGTAVTQITGSYSLPANDAQVGTTYRFKTKAILTWEANSLLVQWYGQQMHLPFGLFAAADTVHCDIEWNLQVTNNGSSGTFTLSGRIDASNTAFSKQGVGTLVFITGSQNWTVAQTVFMSASWGGAAAGQNATFYGSTFERIGP